MLVVGGLERVATSLSVGLQRRGEHVVVCSRGRARGVTVLREELHEAGIQVVPIPRPKPTPRALIESAIRLAAVIRRESPDVVHAHNPAAAVAAALARLLAGRRSTAIVATFHGLVEGETRRAVRPLVLAADVVVGIGPSASQELADAGFPRDRLLTVPNAVTAAVTRSRADVRRELGIADDAELLVTVGRYTIEKGQTLLIEAVARLAPRRPRLRALIVGLGPLENELRESASRLGLGGIVQITGPRADAVDVIAAADVVVSTSIREGLGLTLLEALTVGTPVVASSVGGIPDVLDHGAAGLLFPSGDAEALVAALERALDDAELRERLLAEGRRHVAQNFGVDAMVDGYLSAYATAVSRRRSRSMRRRNGASSSK